jgi:hypothetical protein
MPYSFTSFLHPVRNGCPLALSSPTLAGLEFLTESTQKIVFVPKVVKLCDRHVPRKPCLVDGVPATGRQEGA